MNVHHLAQMRTQEFRINAVEAYLRCNKFTLPSVEIVVYLAQNLRNTTNHLGHHDTLQRWIAAHAAKKALDAATKVRKLKNSSLMPKLDETGIIAWRSFSSEPSKPEVIYF